MILGGGPSIDGVGNAAEFIKHFDIPILGICLGHQLIAKTFGGEVSTSDTESYAQVKINLLDTSNLFKGLESPLDVWSITLLKGNSSLRIFMRFVRIIEMDK